MGKNDPLPEKYRKALSLIKDGSYSYRDIAKDCHIDEDDLQHLRMGTGAEKCGQNVQDLFTKEFQEIQKQLDKEILDLVKKNRKNSQLIIDEYLTKLKSNKANIAKSLPTVVSVANALAKSTPNVNIGSFVYQKGLSPEDIYAEFRRLSGLASDRGTVQSASEGRTGEIPVVAGPRTPASEVEEDTVL